MTKQEEHAENCRVVRAKLRETVEDDDQERGQPVLQVHPSLDGKGRVRLTLSQLANILDMPLDELVNPAFDLNGVAYPGSP